MSTRVATPLDKIEPELRKLWEAAGPRATRARSMTVVALCETEAHVPIAERALAAAAPAHGARSILVHWTSSGAPAISAEVSLLEGARGPSAESVRLEAKGEARAWVPDTVSRLVMPDLPCFVWWVGDLPDHDSLFHRMALGAQATFAVVDANEMDLRDLPVLDRLARRARDERAGVALSDFCWQRLRVWQELVARFFDNPECVEDLRRVTDVRLCFAQRTRDPEPSSTQASLFAGWLAARLGWSPRAWSDDRTTASLSTPESEARVRFAPVRRSGLADGALVEVEIRTSDARYRVHRSEEDPMVICWEGERPGTPIANQCVRVQLPDDGALLGRVLERPVRDALFEASLAAAARLVADVAPERPRP